MFKQFFAIVALASFVVSTTAPVANAGPRYYDPFENYGRSSEVTVSAYFRVPFVGGLSRSVDEPRFGFAMTGDFANKYRDGRRLIGLEAPRFLDLSMGLSGKDSVRFNGFALSDAASLNANDDGSAGWVWALWGLAAVAVGISVAILIQDVKDLNELNNQ